MGTVLTALSLELDMTLKGSYGKGIDLSQGQDEREDAMARVTQVPLEVPGRHPAKREGRAVGKAQGVDRGRDVRAGAKPPPHPHPPGPPHRQRRGPARDGRRDAHHYRRH